MADTLTALDATFLELEQLDEGALMSIGGVMVFDPLPQGGAPAVEEVSANLAARLGQLPRYTQRLSSARTGGWSWPQWTEDERFDIRSHVRRAALPAPGSRAQLCDWAADFYSHRLDRTRPLWEVMLIEGLEDGRWAIAHKTHHCMVDGVGSVDVAYLLLDAEPKPAESAVSAPPVAAAQTPVPLWRTVVPRPPQAVSQVARSGAQAASSGLHAALHPREALARSLSLAELIVRDEVIAAPHSSLNVPIGSTRRYAVARTSLDELKAIGRELSCSVNDALLAACTTGLRRLLLARGEELPPRGLRAMVPMNVRDASDHLALGNRISSLFVDLPVAEPDPRARLTKVAAHTRRLKSGGAATGAAAMIDIAALAPPLLHATLARSLYATRLFNITITNVPGPQIPLYAFGSLMREVYPLVPLAADHSIGIAIFSYNGAVTFGISADCESTPDLDVLTRAVEDGLEELHGLVPQVKCASDHRAP